MEDTVAEPGGLSIEGYARHRGVTRAAVSQRIKAGSLPTGAKQIGTRWVIDPVLADFEWAAHTQPRVSGGYQPAGDGPDPGHPPSGGSNVKRSGLAAATERERNARADAIELEIARKTKALVPAREVDLRWSALVVSARTKLLGLPSRFKQRAPETLASALIVLESLIREALEELAADTQSQGGQTE